MLQFARTTVLSRVHLGTEEPPKKRIIRKVHAYAVASDFCEALCARGATDISPTVSSGAVGRPQRLMK